ncbi:MAG: MerR family transcriptional regulator [Defluviitaleaceae bacterium]|nr:MerR family transcriptional regulator [Defluviitaleaceae bacterium]
MGYTTSQVAKKLGLTKDGLRYYEKEGLFPPISKNESGHRVYSEDDVDWIFLIRCLRDTEMPISKIKQYVSFAIGGGENSITERRKMLKEHEVFLVHKVKIYQSMLELIKKKVEFFDDTLNMDNPETGHCKNYAEEWEQFKLFIGGFERE